MRTKVKFLMPLVLLAFLVGCAYNASLVNTTYDMLQVSAASYDTAMLSAGDLYKRGKITAVEKGKIIKIGKAYSTAHNDAVDVLLAYKKSKDQSDADRLELMITEVSKALSDILWLVRQYTGR